MGSILATPPPSPLEQERAARQRLEALLEFAPAFIIGVSKQGTIDFINRTLPQHDKKDVIGSSWRGAHLRDHAGQGHDVFHPYPIGWSRGGLKLLGPTTGLVNDSAESPGQ